MPARIPYIDAASLPPGFGWTDAVDAIAKGHTRAPAQITDQFLNRKEDSFVNRAAWIEGFGVGVKSFTVFPDNVQQQRPSVQGAMLIFDDRTGAPLAVVDSGLVTYWKTAADSVYGASLLARPDSKTLLIVGSGHRGGQSGRRIFCAFFGFGAHFVMGSKSGKKPRLSRATRASESRR